MKLTEIELATVRGKTSSVVVMRIDRASSGERAGISAITGNIPSRCLGDTINRNLFLFVQSLAQKYSQISTFSSGLTPIQFYILSTKLHAEYIGFQYWKVATLSTSLLHSLTWIRTICVCHIQSFNSCSLRHALKINLWPSIILSTIYNPLNC